VKEAVILSASNIRSGPGENDYDIFTISEGKIVINNTQEWKLEQYKN
jgi:hypothetical protein